MEMWQGDHTTCKAEFEAALDKGGWWSSESFLLISAENFDPEE